MPIELSSLTVAMLSAGPASGPGGNLLVNVRLAVFHTSAQHTTSGAWPTHSKLVFYRNHQNSGSPPHEFYRYPIVADKAPQRPNLWQRGISEIIVRDISNPIETASVKEGNEDTDDAKHEEAAIAADLV
ncbi:hypothetical protein LTR27_007849 [Elasticomyces elasticus]|nr:hypothetical protein LTR27_007849 [Elasticomyces elasticus]